MPEANNGHRRIEHIITDYHLDMLEHDGYLVRMGAVALIIFTPFVEYGGSDYCVSKVR